MANTITSEQYCSLSPQDRAFYLEHKGDPDMPATSYWAPHEANARRALVNLLQLLCLAPDNAKIQIS